MVCKSGPGRGAVQAGRLGSGVGASTSSVVAVAARILPSTSSALSSLRLAQAATRQRRGAGVLCRTESPSARSSQGRDKSRDSLDEDEAGDSILLKELLMHATESRKRLHKQAAGTLSSMAKGGGMRPKPTGKKKGLDPLDFTHDNDYNTINVEEGKQVVTGSLVYEVLTMDWKGGTYRAYLKRRDLLRHYDLQPRDLRRIDPALSDPSPCLSVRDNAILISMGGMRGIISANKAIVFEPDSPYTKKFIEIVSPRLAASSGTTNLEDSDTKEASNGSEAGEAPSGETQQYNIINSVNARKLQEDKNLPFELECCEGSLMVLVGQLDNELDRIELRIGNLLEKLPAQVNTENLEELRKVKSILVELESKSEQVTELLADFLEDEDDIAGMNLTSQLMKKEEESRNSKTKKKSKRKSGKASGSGRSRSEEPEAVAEQEIKGELVTIALDDSEIENILEEAEEELEEVEDLIEYYLQRCTSIFSETQTLLVGMRDMEESISVVLSSRRFEVNRLELALSMGSFAASLGAMISGIFGMNLRNKFEESVAGFYGTTAAIMVLCFAVFWFLYRYTKRRRIL
ncbi:magnesium transporter [Chloropicon primus]|nr:magnesium transporter [Chloropicon primus]UPR00066.1 magnesium transporter [Chloropicon primus]|eukprot:QDZ20853.1 magnesium transporter [Chloropicon primus]